MIEPAALQLDPLASLKHCVLAPGPEIKTNDIN